MFPRKGTIAVGSDADIVVYDPKATRTISAKTHHMDVDYSCYEGRQVRGRSDIVLSRGSVIVRDGQFTGPKGAGKFLKRVDRRLRPDQLKADQVGDERTTHDMTAASRAPARR